MKKKTTTKRRKAMIRKMKKQNLKNKRKFDNNNSDNLIFLNELDQENNKTLGLLKKGLSFIGNALKKTTKSICFLLSMIFTVNIASANISSIKKLVSDDKAEFLIEKKAENSYISKHYVLKPVELLDIDLASTNDEAVTELHASELYYNSIDTMIAKNIITTYEKEQEVINREQLSEEQLNYLLELMQEGNCPFSSIFTTREDALDYLYENEDRSYEEIMLIIMARDGYTYQELDEVCAGCVAESKGRGTCYKDAYAVASIFLNRTNYIPYINAHSTNMHEQFIAPGQFGVYFDKSYLDYLGRIDLIGYQAALDAFYSKYSMHDYLEFRGSWEDVNGKYEQFVENGNKYTVKMKDSNRAVNDEHTDTNDIAKLILKLNN